MFARVVCFVGHVFFRSLTLSLSLSCFLSFAVILMTPCYCHSNFFSLLTPVRIENSHYVNTKKNDGDMNKTWFSFSLLFFIYK